MGGIPRGIEPVFLGNSTKIFLTRQEIYGIIVTAKLYHPKNCLQGEALCGRAAPGFFQFVQKLWYTGHSEAVPFEELLAGR